MHYKTKHRNLILSAKEVINLTSETLWTYGTSGSILELKPKEYSAQMMTIPGAYYIISEELKEKILKEGRIEKEYLLRAKQVGVGRDGDTMSKFYTDSGIQVVPVSENVATATNHVGFLMKPRSVS